MMTDLLKAVLTGIVFSCYYFPFEFVSLPGINTKMMLAVIGAALFVMQWLKEDTLRLNRTFLVVSFLVIFSVRCNQQHNGLHVCVFYSRAVGLDCRRLFGNVFDKKCTWFHFDSMGFPVYGVCLCHTIHFSHFDRQYAITSGVG